MIKLANLSLALCLGLVAGCTAELPDGRFGCTTTAQCPTGFTCDGTLCRRGTGDAGMPVDTGTLDDSSQDALVPRDDTSCTDCITITVTNALGPVVEGKSYMLEDQALSAPPYGETYGPYVVSLADAALDLTGNLGSYTFPATPGNAYVMVIAPGATPPDMGVLVLDAPVIPPAGGHTTIRPMDLLQDADTHAMDDGVGGVRLLSRTGPDDYDLTDGVTPSLMMYRFDVGTGRPATGLAALDPATLPPGLAYYVFIGGRADVHLGASDGIRFIPAIPGSAAIPSLPILWAMNTTGSKVEICDGTRLLTSLVAGELHGALAGAVAARDLQVRAASSGAACTDATMRPFTTPALPAGLVSGRMLIAVTGDVGPLDWGALAGYEGPPSTTAASQVVLYGNGVAGEMLDFGVVGMTMAASVPTLQTGSYEWPSPPADLVVTYASIGARRFPWGPTSSAAAVVAVIDITGAAANEVSMPFGQDLTYTYELGTPLP